MSDLALEVDHLTKNFRLHREKTNSIKALIAARGRTRYDEFTALNDVTFTVKEGEVFGVIGENGSGKSTLLKCMAGILQPNSGQRAGAQADVGVARARRRLPPRAVGPRQRVPQRGHPRHEPQRHRGTVRRHRRFLRAGRFIDAPVKTYSSGMYVRLAFAVAINVDPRLLIIDEILAVGDVSFQQRCLEKFVEFRNEGRTIVLVTHAMNTVKDMCDRAIWLTHGNITGEGDPSDLVEEYTESMLGNRDRHADGSIRRGSGEIQITSVELFTGDGLSPVKRFRTGDSVRIRMTYRADKPVPKPVIGFDIEALGGATVTAPCTRDVGMIPEALSGEGTIEVELDAVSLLPGTYDLHTSITDFNRSHIYDNLHLAFRFDVMSGKPYESGGIVTVRPQWTIA